MATHYFASHKGGIEIVAERLFRGLSERGHEITWVAGDSTAAPDPVGASRTVSLKVINFVERKIGLPFPIPRPNAIRRLQSEIDNADIVLLHDCLYLTNIAAFLIAKNCGVPVLIVQHIGFAPYRNPLLNSLANFANSIVTRPMLAAAEQVTFISERTRSYFKDVRFRRTPEIIFNGVDANVYYPVADQESKLALRRKHALPEDRTVILFVGRFIENKGLSIIKRMAELRPGSMWALAGWGPLNPASWQAENVRVFPGLSGASLAALYRASDVFVLPSRTEAFPLVVQEALACGLPVVCTSDVLKSDSAIGRYIQGIPVYANDDSRTADEFLAAIENALNPVLGPNRLRDFAVSHYSWQDAIDRYVEVLSKLVFSARETTLSSSSLRIFSDHEY